MLLDSSQRIHTHAAAAAAAAASSNSSSSSRKQQQQQQQPQAATAADPAGSSSSSSRSSTQQQQQQQIYQAAAPAGDRMHGPPLWAASCCRRETDLPCLSPAFPLVLLTNSKGAPRGPLPGQQQQQQQQQACSWFALKFSLSKQSKRREQRCGVLGGRWDRVFITWDRVGRGHLPMRGR
ncbi:hypothetical protein Efla_005379 [Eimeria flavescens]